MTHLTCIIRFKKLRIPLQTKPLRRSCFTEQDPPSQRTFWILLALLFNIFGQYDGCPVNHVFPQPLATTSNWIPSWRPYPVDHNLFGRFIYPRPGFTALPIRKSWIHHNPPSIIEYRRPVHTSTQSSHSICLKSNVPLVIHWVSPAIRGYIAHLLRAPDATCPVRPYFGTMIRARHQVAIPSIHHAKCLTGA